MARDETLYLIRRCPLLFQLHRACNLLDQTPGPGLSLTLQSLLKGPTRHDGIDKVGLHRMGQTPKGVQGDAAFGLVHV